MHVKRGQKEISRRVSQEERVHVMCLTRSWRLAKLPDRLSWKTEEKSERQRNAVQQRNQFWWRNIRQVTDNAVRIDFKNCTLIFLLKTKLKPKHNSLTFRSGDGEDWVLSVTEKLLTDCMRSLVLRVISSDKSASGQESTAVPWKLFRQ